MFNFLYINSHLGYWYIIWKVNTRNSGMNLRNTLFVQICLCGWGFHGKQVAWGQLNKQRLEWTRYMLPCHSFYSCGTWRSKEVGFFKVIIRREGGKPQTRGTFTGRHKKTTQGADQWTTLSGITYYFSLLWCKKIYALHKIPSY